MFVPTDARISSRQHGVVKRFHAAARGDDALALLDGAHLIDEALRAGVRIEVPLSNGRWTELEDRARRAGTTVYAGTAPVLDAASPVRSPTGIVALADWRPADMAAALDRSPACVLGLVGVQDPGNAGSAIRSADALNATGVLALDGTADPRGWKALRGAMGSTFHLPVAIGTSDQALDAARSRGLRVVAAVAFGGRPPESLDLRAGTLLLLGSEGSGIAPGIQAQADDLVTVPMRAGVESLNVAVTSALLLYEVRRQRVPQ